MQAGNHVVMDHPDGYATIRGSGGRFVGWVPNGIEGTIYLLTPDRQHALVNFAGQFLTTVPVEHLRVVAAPSVAPAA